MRTLTPREKRSIRFGGIAIGIYLVLFLGFQLWKGLEQKRSEYQAMIEQAKDLRSKIEPYQTKVLVVGKLMKEFQLDPAKLSGPSVVAQASAAIQDEAKAEGIKLGTIRESPAQPSSRELASIHIEGSGPIPTVLGLLEHLKRLGYPLIVDSVKLTSETTRPGQVKLALTIVILDFDQWKSKKKTTEAAHA